MGIDYGRRRIGIAVGETEFGLFSTRPYLDATGSIERDAAALWRLAEHEQASLVVLGFPGHAQDMDSNDGEMCRGILLLRDALVLKGLEVELLDETLTTVEADERMRAAGLKASERKRRIDSEAAVRILELYLGANAP